MRVLDRTVRFVISLLLLRLVGRRPVRVVVVFPRLFPPVGAA